MEAGTPPAADARTVGDDVTIQRFLGNRPVDPYVITQDATGSLHIRRRYKLTATGVRAVSTASVIVLLVAVIAAESWEQMIVATTLAAAMAAVGIWYLWQAHRLPEWTFDAEHRTVTRTKGRQVTVVLFDELDGVHWWENRHTNEQDEDKEPLVWYEVYLRRGETRNLLTWFSTRSEAEALAETLNVLMMEQGSEDLPW